MLETDELTDQRNEKDYLLEFSDSVDLGQRRQYIDNFLDSLYKEASNIHLSSLQKENLTNARPVRNHSQNCLFYKNTRKHIKRKSSLVAQFAIRNLHTATNLSSTNEYTRGNNHSFAASVARNLLSGVL
ncbi:Hypothetical predicted protein [Octopus vulgaris]|uniref:Uncharacterized protein n=1 Tax=Octopus vulgaris TaxID=6645 RepID=A0AA36ARX7_OCTVU|nr:Hypothetical predicted protein [Octopus vulgaris]